MLNAWAKQIIITTTTTTTTTVTTTATTTTTTITTVATTKITKQQFSGSVTWPVSPRKLTYVSSPLNYMIMNKVK